ncbi:hypothetical protein DL96DRAFT_1791622 [Flagelloscypha sp. PMI_526]|nr:hypothetical protein DL96DRAFT_1791622 [Flagelloscypha sp. PMI_526]
MAHSSFGYRGGASRPSPSSPTASTSRSPVLSNRKPTDNGRRGSSSYGDNYNHAAAAAQQRDRSGSASGSGRFHRELTRPYGDVSPTTWNASNSPTISVYSRERRDSFGSSRTSTTPVDQPRMFEPSDAWKRSNYDSSQNRNEPAEAWKRYTHDSSQSRTPYPYRETRVTTPTSPVISRPASRTVSSQQNGSFDFGRSPSIGASSPRLQVKITAPLPPTRPRADSQRGRPSIIIPKPRGPTMLPPRGPRAETLSQHARNQRPYGARERDQETFPTDVGASLQSRSRSSSVGSSSGESIASSRASTPPIPSTPHRSRSRSGSDGQENETKQVENLLVVQEDPKPQMDTAETVAVPESILPSKDPETAMDTQEPRPCPPKRNEDGQLPVPVLDPVAIEYCESVPLPPLPAKAVSISLSTRSSKRIRAAQQAKAAKDEESSSASQLRQRAITAAIQLRIHQGFLEDADQRDYSAYYARRDLRERGTKNTSESLIESITDRVDSLKVEDSFTAIEPHLQNFIQQRDGILAHHVNDLNAQYLDLYGSWRRHCDALDYQTQSKAQQQLGLDAGPASRTTRRSAAAMSGGDMARSDFEMEQILATLEADGATDPAQLCLHNLATIPDMISTTKGPPDYVFDDTNHLVRDPAAHYAPTVNHDHWTPEEIGVYFQKYAAFPKQFGIISEFLPNKSTAECVDFYYMHKKKVIDFRQIITRYAPTSRGRKKKLGKGKRKGILSDIRQHDDAVASTKPQSRSTRVQDPTPSTTSASAPVSASGRPKRTTKPRSSVLSAASISRKASTSQQGDGESSTAASTPEPERAQKRKRAPLSAACLLLHPLPPYQQHLFLRHRLLFR